MVSQVTIQKLKDTFEAAAVNGAAISISLNSVEQWLRLLSIGIAIGYTIWKWRSDVRKRKANEEDK